MCNKIVETERGVATTYKGNYTQYLRQKNEKIAQQYSAFDKWNKEAQKQKDIIRRCAASCSACCEIFRDLQLLVSDQIPLL